MPGPQFIKESMEVCLRAYQLEATTALDRARSAAEAYSSSFLRDAATLGYDHGIVPNIEVHSAQPR